MTFDTKDGEFEKLVEHLSVCLQDRTHLRDLYAELKSQQQRLIDLVRYQRQELHEAGLINDAEYAWLLEDAGSVGRLETYDKVRAERDRLQRAYDTLMSQPFKTVAEAIREGRDE